MRNLAAGELANVGTYSCPIGKARDPDGGSAAAGEPTKELEPRSAARLTFLNSHNCVKLLFLSRTETENV